MARVSAAARVPAPPSAACPKQSKPDTDRLTTRRCSSRSCDLAAEILAERVERVVRDLGPLTDEQCRRIAALLQAGGAA